MSTVKRRIGISFSTTNFQHYWSWFSQGDLADDLEVVLLSFQDNNVNNIGTCQAFVLTGGVDVHPSLYAGNEHYPNAQDFQPERDAFEKAIYDHARQTKKPVLAICRGMQLVNVLHGGKLLQDLGSLNTIHRKEGVTDKLHKVKVIDNSLLSEVTDSKLAEINSAHHQAIDPAAIGSGLMATAKATADGTIEALELIDKKNNAFLLCVQWHPERMADQQSPFAKNIKQRFLKEVRKQ